MMNIGMWQHRRVMCRFGRRFSDVNVVVKTSQRRRRHRRRNKRRSIFFEKEENHLHRDGHVDDEEEKIRHEHDRHGDQDGESHQGLDARDGIRTNECYRE